MRKRNPNPRPLSLSLLVAFLASLLFSACHGNPSQAILADGGAEDASDNAGPWHPPTVPTAGSQDVPGRFGTAIGSPAVLVNSTSLGAWTATTDGVNVAAGETVSVKLADSAGARLWQLSVVGTDERVVAPAITQASVITGSATFTAPAAGSPAGWALIVRSTIGVTALGNDSTGKTNPAYSTTFGLYLPTSNSYRVGAVNETIEGSAAYGWVSKFNPLLRANIATGSGVGTDRTLATTGLLQGGGNLSTDRTLSVIPGSNGQVAVTAAGTPSWSFISNSNISSSAAIDLSKISQTSATSGQAITWNGTQWAPGPVIGGTGSVAASVADLAALRAVLSVDRADNQSRGVGSPASTWIYSTSSGSGFADDGLTVVKPGDVLLAANGRWYPASPQAVVPTIAALRAAVAGKQSVLHVQAYSTIGDGGGGSFNYDSSDTTTADNTGTVVVAGTRRYKRIYSGSLQAAWFGVRADGFKLTTATRTAASAHLVAASPVFTAAMVGRSVLVREPSSLAAGTLTIAGGGSPIAQGAGTNVVADLVPISGSDPNAYQPASGGAIYINGSYYAANYGNNGAQQLTLFIASPTQTTKAWYTQTQTATTITAFNSSTDVTLAASATVTQSGNVLATIATDDTTAITNAVNAAFDLGVRELDMPSGLSGISSNIGFTSKSNLTIRWPNPEGSALVDLRKVSDEIAYPNATNYYGAFNFVSCDGIHIVGGSYDGSVPVLGVVHSAGGSINNSGSRSGFSMTSSTNSSFEDVRSVGFGARDEHLYVQGTSRNFLFDHVRVVGNNNVSINFNGSGSGDDDVRVQDSWATGILLASASFVVDNCHITTNGDARLAGGITVGNVGHGVISNNILHDINLLSTGSSMIDVFGGNNADSSLSIRGNKIVHNNGLWDSGHGAPIKINNHGGTVTIDDNVIDKNTAFPSAGRFIDILGSSLGKVQIGGTNVLRGRAGSLMTIGIEVESGVPAGAVTIDDGIVYGESITTRVVLGNTGGKGRLEEHVVVSATGTTALSNATESVLVTANGSVTLTLADATKVAGRKVIVKNDSTQAGTTTVGAVAGTVELTSLPGANLAAIYWSDGTNWKVLTGSSVGGGVPSTRQVIAGAGMTQTPGTTLASDMTMNVVAADSTIQVNADSIQVGTGVAVSKLSPGSNGQALITSGGVTVWGSPSGGSVTLAGDVTGASGSNVVEKVTGVAGSVAVPSGDVFTWASSGPIFGARTGTAADAMIKVATPGSSITFFDATNLIAFMNYNAGSPYLQQFNGTGFRLISTNGDLSLTASSASTNVLINPGNATKATFKSTGVLNLADATAPGSSPTNSMDVYVDSSTHSLMGRTHSGYINTISPNGIFWPIAQTELRFQADIGDILIQQAINTTGNGSALRVGAQNALASGNRDGGLLILQGGLANGSGVPGHVQISPGTVSVVDVSTTEVTLNKDFLSFEKSVSPLLSQKALTAGVHGHPMTIIAQSAFSGGGGLGGPVSIQGGAGDAGDGSHGDIVLAPGGSTRVSIRKYASGAAIVIAPYGGSPETAVTGAKGDLIIDVTNADLYVKSTASGNTGWKLVTRAPFWSEADDLMPANDNAAPLAEECGWTHRSCAGWR